MKEQIFVFICLGILVVFCSSLFAETYEEEPIKDDSGKWHLLIFGGPAYQSYNEKQFDEALEDANLEASFLPLATRFATGFDMMLDLHMLTFYFDYTYANMETWKDNRHLRLTSNTSTVHLGYGYMAADWVSIRADTGVSLGNWRYMLVTGSDNKEGEFNGQVQSGYFALPFQVGVMFHLPKRWILQVHGGWSIHFLDFMKRYSGDWDKDNFDNIILNRAFAGLDVGMRF